MPRHIIDNHVRLIGISRKVKLSPMDRSQSTSCKCQQIQPEIDIGTLGHVDNGKSTIVQSLTGVWTSRHSEELRRGITIRIGYADASFYECPTFDPPSNYSMSKTCPNCHGPTKFLRSVIIVDCHGHHSLMVTMLSTAAIMASYMIV